MENGGDVRCRLLSAKANPSAQFFLREHDPTAAGRRHRDGAQGIPGSVPFAIDLDGKGDWFMMAVGQV